MHDSLELIRSAEMFLGPRGDDLLYPKDVLSGIELQHPLTNNAVPMHAGIQRYRVHEIAVGRKPYAPIPFIFDCSGGTELHLSGEPRDGVLCMLYPEIAEQLKCPRLSLCLYKNFIVASFTAHPVFPNSRLFIGGITNGIHRGPNETYVLQINGSQDRPFALPIGSPVRLSLATNDDQIPQPLLDVATDSINTSTGQPLPIEGAIATLLYLPKCYS